MKNALIIVGKNIKYNKSFTQYIEREVLKSLYFLSAVYYLDKNDNDLLLSIEEIVHRYKRVVIATRDGFNLVGKILSTVSEDSLVLRDAMLVPSRSINSKENSYLLKIKKNYINVLKVDELEKVPHILIKKPCFEVGFFLFDMDESMEEVLDEIIKIYDVDISNASVAIGLNYITAYGFIHEQYSAFKQAIEYSFINKSVLGNDLAAVIAEKLKEHNKTVTFAESCTGGLLASEFVKNSGVSEVFKGSFVTYSNEVKRDLLAVSEINLKHHGAVSVQVVYEMLDGAIEMMNSDMAIAISGVAGPDGGTKEKPVGTIYIGAKSKGGDTLIEKLELNGDRIYIQEQAVISALKLLMTSDKKTFF